MPSRSKSIALQRQFALTADGYRLLHEETWEQAERSAYLSHLMRHKSSHLKMRKIHVKAKKVDKITNFGRWCLKDQEGHTVGFIEVEISGGRFAKSFIYGLFSNSQSHLRIIREALYSVAAILSMIEGCSVFYVFASESNLAELSASKGHLQTGLTKNKNQKGLTVFENETYLKFDETDMKDCELGQILFDRLAYFEKRKKRLDKMFQ